MRALKTTTYGFSRNSRPVTACATPRGAAGELVHQLHRAPGGEREDQRRARAAATSHGAEAERVAEREERPHREQVAAVLAALDMAEVAGRRPRARHVGQEADRVDVQVDLRVRGRQARPLQQRDDEREDGKRRDKGTVSEARAQGGEDTSA